jgi:D-alanyl-D-alanine dipeptidase
MTKSIAALVAFALVLGCTGGDDQQTPQGYAAAAGTGTDAAAGGSGPAPDAPVGSADGGGGEDAAGSDAQEDAAANGSDGDAAHSALLPALHPQVLQKLSTISHLLVVVTPAWASSHASLGLFARQGTGWSLALGPWPAEVGSKGLSWGRGLTSPPAKASRVKIEGDKTAPAGIFRLGTAMGYAAQPPAGLEIPYRQSTAETICVDDPKSSHYNSIVEATGAVAKDWISFENMLRADNLYSLLALVDHNGLLGDPKPVPGAGSCIFLHLWSGPGSPTIGCTALDGGHVRDLLVSLVSLDQVLLVQLPRAEYDDAVTFWGLPAFAGG